MAKQETLVVIHSEIETGKLGKARDRLHGLITTYPEDLSLRDQLGEVYWHLQDPAMAGRYWYLTNGGGNHAEAARKAFEASLGNSPTGILEALKFRGNLDMLSEDVQERIEALQEEHIKVFGRRLEWTKPGKEKGGSEDRETKKTGKLIKYGCILGLVLVLTLMIFGFIWLVQQLF